MACLLDSPQVLEEAARLPLDGREEAIGQRGRARDDSTKHMATVQFYERENAARLWHTRCMHPPLADHSLISR